MSKSWLWIAVTTTLALAAGVAVPARAHAAAATNFPFIKVWGLVGAWQDSTEYPLQNYRCIGSFHDRSDSLRRASRTITVRFLRDRVAESRPDFGGYRIYRMVNTKDSTSAMLLRRYSVNVGSELTWHFSHVDTATGNFMCTDASGATGVVHDSVITFVDPDSSGNYIKKCRRYDNRGRCITPGDSVLVLDPPPGPHDDFMTWYAITYEALNGRDTNDEDMFVPDSSSNFARCDTTGLALVRWGTTPTASASLYAHVVNSCPNLNNKFASVVGPIQPNAGAQANLTGIAVVPNPYRGHEVWDASGESGVKFVRLTQQATIKIFTVSGDLVRTLHHNDPINNSERWDLRSDAGKEVASGIYLYRVDGNEAGRSFTFQSRFIVIR